MPSDTVQSDGVGAAQHPDLRGAAHDLTGRTLEMAIRCAADGAALLDTVIRGADAEVTIELDPVATAGLLDELGRVAEVRLLDRSGTESAPRRGHPDAATGGADGLDPDGVALLELLGAGATVAAAAQQLHLSTRSAYRTLARLRESLGVPTNVEALLAIRRDLRDAADRAARPADGKGIAG